MRRIPTKHLAILIVPIFLFTARGNASQNDSDTSKLDNKYITAVNEFGFKMLKNLTAGDSTHNVFISPVSILYALAMASDGANGSTGDSIRNALQLQDFTRNEINESNYQSMKSLMMPDTSVELHIANSLWLNYQFKLKPEFTKDCEENYSAATMVRDFSKDSTLTEINGWVKDKTKGKIAGIVNKLSPDDLLLLLDAVYFYGNWTYPFDSSRTKEKPFFFLDGSEKKYPRMFQSKTFDYYENSQYQTVSIPYGKRFSMYIVLPRERDGLPSILKELNISTWSALISQMKKREGNIELPRFKIDYFVSLVKTLKNLGMGIAFGDSADFSRMTYTPVHISDVLHKTYLDVNEKGTEAAAVTAVGIGMTTSVHPPPPKPFEMIIDHPFYCCIRDNTTGLILFAGSIIDPKSEI